MLLARGFRDRTKVAGCPCGGAIVNFDDLQGPQNDTFPVEQLEFKYARCSKLLDTVADSSTAQAKSKPFFSELEKAVKSAHSKEEPEQVSSPVEINVLAPTCAPKKERVQSA